MIKYQNEDKTLVIPSGLGNFPSVGGGGGDVTRQDVINIVDSAITEYDTEIQVDLEDIRENVSGNTEDIAALSAATEAISGSITAVTASVDNLSGAVTSLTEGIETLSAATDNMGSDIESLSAATGNIQSNVDSISAKTDALDTRISANTEAVQALSGVPADIASISAQTSANTAQIEALSGVVETNESAISNLENYTQNELAPAIGGIGQDLEALSGQVGTLSSSTVNGLETAQNTANSARTEASSAYTLADSAYTRADAAYALAESLSGGSSGGPQVIFLNKLTEQERLALYNELASKYDDNAQSWTSAYTEDEYAFYIDLRDHADQETYQTSDHYEGFFPMQLERMHPSDYGGAAFFGGVEAAREGNGNLIQIRFVITFEGGYENSTWWNSPSSDPTMQFNLRINSDGTIANDQDWSYIADSNNATRVVMQYYEGTQYGDIYSEGKVKWVNMYPTTYDNETKWYWIWAADICIGTTMYSGVWGMLQDQWYTTSDVPPQVLQWTSGATYESQTYPPIV